MAKFVKIKGVYLNVDKIVRISEYEDSGNLYLHVFFGKSASDYDALAYDNETDRSRDLDKLINKK